MYQDFPEGQYRILLFHGLGIFGLLIRRCMIRAEVIKIEHPTRGDDTRAWGPPYAKHIKGDKTDSPGESAYYISVSLPLP